VLSALLDQIVGAEDIIMKPCNHHPKRTYETGDADRKAEHDHCVQHTDIYAQFKSIRRYNTQQLARECKLFDFSPVLLLRAQ
jgi:hypothetical protein